MIGDLYLRVWY